jgi:hypothetical protein
VKTGNDNNFVSSSPGDSNREAPDMQRIPRDLARKYAFDWRDEPLLRVRPGESFEVETWDAGTGYFKTPADRAGSPNPGRPQEVAGDSPGGPAERGESRTRQRRISALPKVSLQNGFIQILGVVERAQNAVVDEVPDCKLHLLGAVKPRLPEDFL